MPRERQRKTDSTKVPRQTHEEKLRALSHRGVQVDPSNKRAVTRAYQKYVKQRVPKDMERRTNKETRAELRKHGFRVTDIGVIVDGPRDAQRRPIKGSRVQILKGGVVKTSIKSRKDFIYGFTKKEKKQFAAGDQRSFILERLRELQKTIPSLRKKKLSDLMKTTRLQWGAYQGTKDFSPTHFTKRYFAERSPDEISRVGKRKAKPRLDTLTGIHIVIHTAPKGKKKHGKGKRK